ncbi:homoserine O-succinyltransferase [Bacillus sp. FJAT-42376]|uniref:homoserine O-acetyltransferase MetA n=1 Tax=Bacillus sp. FJAT-42376 TaxID=2014076 RepID=UPI000F4D8E04|nr:homoserine O-succinyltransferase [Bacillus sp. FJAT-42376]AZB43263.1 homoserine O-succinyltransferase [Bacillus sp. FJAT-42376]
MPINIPSNLPAKAILEEENIFIMDEHRAAAQDIRPLDILILNLMPQKEKTETQLLRLLGNTPLQVNITFLHMKSHTSKNVEPRHLEEFYTTFDHIRHRSFDGLIITGAPVEQMPFEEVSYWEELQQILHWSSSQVTSTLHICWGAQAGLYFHYGVEKVPLETKCFGIFAHTVKAPSEKLVRGFDEEFYVPHSRHTDISKEQALSNKDLIILSESDEAGVCLLKSRDGKRIFLTGHPEYDAYTLDEEYKRDLHRGIPISLPLHYYKNDQPENGPLFRWKSHASLLFSNWLNYYVYQETPFDWKHTNGN